MAASEAGTPPDILFLEKRNQLIFGKLANSAGMPPEMSFTSTCTLHKSAQPVSGGAKSKAARAHTPCIDTTECAVGRAVTCLELLQRVHLADFGRHGSAELVVGQVNLAQLGVAVGKARGDAAGEAAAVHVKFAQALERAQLLEWHWTFHSIVCDMHVGDKA